MSPVVFPHGKYIISAPVQIYRTAMRGENAVIENNDLNPDSFIFNSTCPMHISGFTFRGGCCDMRSTIRRGCPIGCAPRLMNAHTPMNEQAHRRVVQPVVVAAVL